MLADVRHVEEILVDARFPQRVAEQGFVRPRRAGGDHDAIEPLVPDRVGDRLSGVGGAGEQAFLRMDDVAERARILDQRGDVDHPADIGTATADEDPDPGLLVGDRLLRRIDPVRGQLAPPGPQQLRRQSPRRARREDGFGNIPRPLERTADEDALPGGLDRVDRIGLAEPVRLQFDAELPGQLLGVGRRIEPDRQHHQIELLLLHPVVGGGVADGDVLGFGNLPADRHIASDEPHPRQLLRPLVEALEILAVGPDVVVEDRRLHVGVVILGEDHLLLGVRAADRRTIGVSARNDLPGADAVDPRDPVRMLPVGRTPDLALVRAGGAEQALEVETGDDVLVGAVAVVAPHPGIERLVAGRQHDRPDLDLHLLGHLVEIDGVVLAHALADRAGVVLQPQAALVDIGDERHRLGKIDVNRLVQRQVLVERIRDLHRTVFDAGGAAGALVLDDVTRLLDRG